MRARLIVLLALSAGSAGAAPQPQVRVVFEAKGPVLVSQQLRIDVTVLAPNYFLSPVQFPQFDLPGAVVTLPDENALNGTETIDGETYASIRKSYLITAQQAGNFVLPPAPITFRYAAEPGQPGVEATLTLPPQGFSAKLPAGAQAGTTAVVGKVVITQTLDGDPKTMKVGDALTRTVEIFAPNTQAMMIPPPLFDTPEGARVYVRDPVLSDVTTARGDFTGGKRIDRATYVFEQPGACALPSIELSWYNAETGKPQNSTAPAIEVSVGAAPVAQTAIAPPAPSAPMDDVATRNDRLHTAIWSLGLFAVTLAALWAWYVFAPRVRARMNTRRESRHASEASAFAQLKRACGANDPVAAYHALGVWARCQGFASIQTLCQDAPKLRAATLPLERKLYAADATSDAWSGRALIDGAAAKRATLRSEQPPHRLATALPMLNP